MKKNKITMGILALSCVLWSTAFGSTPTYTVTNEMTGVNMCYNGINSGGGTPTPAADLVPAGTSQTLPSTVSLPTNSSAGWSGINYNLRPSTCSCEDTSCAYLGNVNLSASNSSGSVTVSESGITVNGFKVAVINSSNPTAYEVLGSTSGSGGGGSGGGGSGGGSTPPTNAQTITNKTPYLLCNGVTNGGSVGVTYASSNRAPAGTLAPGDSVALSTSGGGFSGVNFNVRQGGCTTNDSYDGNINLSTVIDSTNHTTSVDIATAGPSSDGVTINMTATCEDYTGTYAGLGCNLNNISLLPPAQVTLDTPKTYVNNTAIQYRGVNLSGSEFATFWGPGNTPYPQEMNYYIQKGMNTVRFPIRWAYLEPSVPTYVKNQKDGGSAQAPLNPTYLAFVENDLEDLTEAGVYVVVDLHDYQRYAPQGEYTGVPPNNSTGGVPDGKIDTPQELASIWSLLVQTLQQDSNIKMDHLIFDLNNEPAQMNTQDILANENAAIAAIRKAGANNLVLVEGNYFSGLWAWENTSTYDNGSQTAAPSSQIFTPQATQYGPGIVDPDNNYAINVHQYFDANGSMSGTTSSCFPAASLLTDINAANFMQWVKANKVKVFVSEFGVGTSSSTAGSTQSNCMSVLTNFLTWMQQNAYTPSSGGFIGWTIWSAGHAWGGYGGNGYPNYILDVSPNPPIGSTTPTDSPQMQTLLQGGFLS